MQLAGSCHCGAVRFRVESHHPYPYQRCHCSICRKTQGGGGFAINLNAEADTLRVTGRKHIRIYHARLREPGAARSKRSPAERHFCGECGSALWLYDARWPTQVHPFASAVDTALPLPPTHTDIFLANRVAWDTTEPGERRHAGYPTESIAEWHERSVPAAKPRRRKAAP